MTTLPLFRETLDDRFHAFHAENPHVYAALREKALELVAAGRKRLSIKMLFEVLRWEHLLTTTDPDFKLNNNYHSRYARLLMDRNPTLRGVFETRELHS
jgi:hypothetical protein